MALGSGGLKLWVPPQRGCLDPVWMRCVHPGHPVVLDLVGLALLLLAAKPLKLCDRLFLAVSDLGAHTHSDHCPTNGYAALQGQSFGKRSLGIGKEIPHKYLAVTAQRVLCTEPAQWQGMLSGKCSEEAVGS